MREALAVDGLDLDDGGALLREGGVELRLDLHGHALDEAPDRGIPEPRLGEGIDPHAPHHQRRGEAIGQAELGLEDRMRIAVARDLQRRAIGFRGDARDALGREPVLLLEGHHRVDGGVGVAAGGVVLLAHRGDVEPRAQRRERRFPVDVAAHGGAEAALALHEIERAREAALGSESRGDADLGRVTGMHGLAHAIRPERLLQPRRERAGIGEGMGCVCRIEAQHRGGCRRGAEAADRAGGVPELVMRGHHGGANARADLVAGDDSAEKRRA